MARQSQGLQVLLIVFVMLTVVLGVTTYLYSKKADEATKAALSATQAKSQAEQAAADKQKESEALKTMMIGGADKSMDDVKKQFADDGQTYGGAKGDADPAAGDKAASDTGMPYTRMLASMAGTIQDRTDKLASARGDVANYEQKFKNREAAQIHQIDTYKTSFDTTKEQINKVAGDYDAAQKTTADEQARIVQQISKIKEDEAKKTAAAADEVRKATTVVQQTEQALQEEVRKRRLDQRQEMDIPSGEITFVSLQNKMVWINRGKADNLQRQTQFTVFSGDSVSGAKAVPKGKVEVTRITGLHEAEARIVDDKLTDPVMAGDKVFTPLWSPGQQNHFVLAGIMNLDGDGRNQIGVVRGYINNSGGVVDCELDEQGRKVGQITATTRYIVEGDMPDKASAEARKNNGTILDEAKRWNLQVMKLGEFKQRMGYQKSSSVEHFGSVGPSTNDASRAPKPAKAAKVDAGGDGSGN